MADVKTESLNTPSKYISPVNKMTVEKQQTGQANQQSTSKNRTSQTKGSEAPSVNPVQVRVASGNISPASPKKIDPKGLPAPNSPGISGAHPRSQVQQVGKNKGNPWHKPSPPASGGSGSQKGQTSSPVGKAENEVTAGSTQARDSGIPSKSILIPKDQVIQTY